MLIGQRQGDYVSTAVAPVSEGPRQKVRSIQIKGSRKSGWKVIIYPVNGAIKLIHQLFTARPRSILQPNVKMTI